jgi:sortase A
MSVLLRRFGATVVVVGLVAAAWAVLVWRWQEPFTTLYTTWKQGQLEDAYAGRVDRFGRLRVMRGASPASVRREIGAEAARYRRTSRRGEAIGRLRIARLDLDMIVVNGADARSLRSGPGRDLRTYMPGEGQLVYLAGHRTMFGAPFVHIDRLRRGDVMTLELPYAVFRYAVTGHAVFPKYSPARLRSLGRERLALEAGRPRFFPSRRYLVFARPVRVTRRGGPSYRAV